MASPLVIFGNEVGTESIPSTQNDIDIKQLSVLMKVGYFKISVAMMVPNLCYKPEAVNNIVTN